ncbi:MULTISPECIES: penicillin-binding transpeptidase domain-containing protein [unclassified Mesotoga]|uniref:penicillin-binding transpeptidase domain-containing protein n=1 Tax=unclassified Mesotoga TaxID=1184398 RepID=UPI000EF1885F|nr:MULTISPECIES: penicillin-binding transpeptidase domain-containing protein [unclassified Mesotoga]MDD3681242.1 penicillin-binding transpeptidase domain-containing protein [Mesotoga sp.]MDD4207051.1 penicillin-binding transpeptidase domain-containing protein [Mesotoga sp.]RLL87520.1 peptidoglycan glycosyltransferase [Mesotoga sp. BH458_6_3_2_1]
MRAGYISLFTEPDIPVILGVNKIPALRGSIYDSKGRLLASDSIIYEAWLDLGYLRLATSSDQIERVLRNIELSYGIPYEILHENLQSTKNFLLLGTTPTNDEMQRKITPITKRYISLEMQRERLSFSEYGLDRILGKLDKGGVPLNGIELSYTEELSGKEDGLIRRTLTSTVREEPTNGSDVYLSIDIDIQKMVYEELLSTVEKNMADGGVALLVESKTGKVLAYAGTYNWDVGLMGIFEPGSTIKPLIYSLALQSGSITETMTFNCDGRIQPVPGLDIIIRDTEGERHGIQTFREAIINSCNVATVQVGGKILNTLGKEEMYRQLNNIGFGRLSGVDLPGETPGIMPEAKDWSLISPYQFPIGQGLGVNIFQMVKALNVFPAGGQFLIPTFARAIRSNDGLLNIPKKVDGTLFSSQLVSTMLPIMESVVIEGTGTMAKVDGVRIAGKTGTAQKAGPGGYNEETYFSLFFGFFPVENPTYTLYIMIDTPKAGAYYGGFVAAPMFASVVRNLYGIGVEKEVYEGVYSWKMPDLGGYSLLDVKEVAEIYGIDKIVVHGSGEVINQYPDAGQPLLDRMEIWLGALSNDL